MNFVKLLEDIQSDIVNTVRIESPITCYYFFQGVAYALDNLAVKHKWRFSAKFAKRINDKFKMPETAISWPYSMVLFHHNELDAYNALLSTIRECLQKWPNELLFTIDEIESPGKRSDLCLRSIMLDIIRQPSEIVIIIPRRITSLRAFINGVMYVHSAYKSVLGNLEFYTNLCKWLAKKYPLTSTQEWDSVILYYAMNEEANAWDRLKYELEYYQLSLV
jgi:hypothetical protein